MHSFVSDGLERALIFFDVLGYAPTRIEWFTAWDRGPDNHQHGIAQFQELERACEELYQAGHIQELRGRVVFLGREALVTEHESREAFFSRKIRRAQNVVRWLRRLGGVRFVALCNTTALAHAKDEGDLDFFIVTRAGSLWQTRALAALPFKLSHKRPRPDRVVPDAVCLSFFIDDQALNLAPLMLPEDVYFRHWFLSFIPLFDDGVSKELWEANATITGRHPFARPWLFHPEMGELAPKIRLPVFQVLDSIAQAWQEKFFHPDIKHRVNKDTCVVANQHVLKFHIEDARERYQSTYAVQCHRKNLAP